MEEATCSSLEDGQRQKSKLTTFFVVYGEILIDIKHYLYSNVKKNNFSKVSLDFFVIFFFIFALLIESTISNT